MTTWRTNTHSDDCCSFYRGKKSVGPDESRAWGVWWPMMVDGVHVADVMSDFDHGWEFHIRSVKGVDVEIDFAKDPEHRSGCQCCQCEDECDEWCEH